MDSAISDDALDQVFHLVLAPNDVRSLFEGFRNVGGDELFSAGFSLLFSAGFGLKPSDICSLGDPSVAIARLPRLAFDGARQVI